MKSTKPEYETKHVRVVYNPLSGDWLAIPKLGCRRLDTPYACDTLSSASQMAQTMDHYEETGEQKAFRARKLTRVIR